MSDLKTAIGH